MINKNFASIVIDAGGSIHPLTIPATLTNGTGLTNPSILVVNDEIIVNLRHIQYTLYHAELNKYEHQWGPLVYLNPENDITLTTVNYICKLNNNTLEIESYHRVDTSKFDKPPLWEFVGLEDARLVNWNNKFYLCGVRRDTTTHGEGRMELSEIIFSNSNVIEVSRSRIPAPGKNDSYCEKNWMPILDKPFHFVKWTNSTEVVKVDVEKLTCETVFLGEYTPMPSDLRGGSQVISWGNGYLTLNHETDLYTSEAGRKDGTYRHRFTYWDKDFKNRKFSELFSFMDAKIEFACGMTEYRDNVLITFGFQDNAAFIIRIPKNLINKMIND